MSFAWFWHSQIPFSADARCSTESVGSKRGPPDEAAVIWAATPTFTALETSKRGPLVNWRQSGLEQRSPTRWARMPITAAEKSSRWGFAGIATAHFLRFYDQHIRVPEKSRARCIFRADAMIELIIFFIAHSASQRARGTCALIEKDHANMKIRCLSVVDAVAIDGGVTSLPAGGNPAL